MAQYDFTIELALVDYIPVILFAIAGVILACDLKNKMGGFNFLLFNLGVWGVFAAGACKATWKLLIAANIADIQILNKMFFPTQSIGFLLAGVGILLMLLQRSGKSAALAVAPPVFSGTFVFVGLMVAGLGVMDTVLCILAARMKKPWLIAIFVISFVCSLGMGYLSSKDFAEASMNWIAEGVNVVGQGTLLLGVYLLHKNGLADIEAQKEA